MAGMSPWDFKTFWERLTGGDAVAEVSQELGGQPAWERLLTRAGYAGQPQGFMVRFGDDLHRALPLRLDRDSRLALAEHLEVHPLVMAARAQAATGYPSGETPRPASQLEMSPEKTAALWPWLSGQGFLRLCRSCFLSGDEELGHAAQAHLDQVCAANPPLMGPAWTTAELLALRAVNWLWGLRFLGTLHDLDQQLLGRVVVHLEVIAQTLMQALDDQGTEAEPEGAAPAAALMHLGRALVCLPEAAEWLAAGARGLGPALLAWDRPGPRRPTAALAAACEWGGLGLWAGGGAGVELPGVVGGLTKLAAICRALAPPWGAGSYWGWHPGAPVLGFAPRPESPFTGPANLAAVLLNEPDLRARREMDERLYWLFGPGAAERLRQLAGGRDPRPLEAPGAGLVLACGRSQGRRLGLALRLGADDQSDQQAAAEALDLALTLEGRSILLTPGPAGSGPLDGHLRQRAAHNPPRLDETEPQPGVVSLEALEASADHLFLAASQQAYGNLSDPASLRRRVYVDLKRGIVDVIDQIQARGRHLVEVCYRLPPGTRVRALEDGLLALEGSWGRGLLRPEPTAKASLLQGRSQPPLGWRAVELGQVEPAPVVRVRALVEGDARLTTAFLLPPVESDNH